MNEAPYGYCPHCGLPGVTRERRPGGDDRCDAGHAYPSRTARQPAPTPDLTAEQERAAIVSWLRARPGYGPVADAIERGEHRREEER